MTKSQVLLRERLVYTLASLATYALVGMLGYNRLWFVYTATAFLVFLLFIRVFHFYQIDHEYYFANYCYPSILLMIYNVVDPSSQFRLHFGYCLSMGVTTGVILYRCSLIPQSCMKFISFYIHIISTPMYLAMDFAGLIDRYAVPQSEIIVTGGCLMVAYFLFYILYIFFGHTTLGQLHLRIHQSKTTKGLLQSIASLQHTANVLEA